ncbi:MAG: phage tail tape measure protein [Marinobacterium sp.]
MSAKDLALNLLIKAKDMASGVVRNFKEEVEGSGTAAEKLDRSLDKAEEGIEQLEAATDDAGKITGHFVNQLTEADKAAGRYYDSAGRMHDANGRFVKGAKRARTETDRLGNELDQAGRKADGLSGRVGVLVGRLKGLVAATAIGAGLKWFFGQSIGSAARFERQMNRVEAVTNATAEEMAVLEKAAEEAGSTTEYSAVQAAEGLEILARAGFNASQSVELLPSVLAVAAAEGVDLATAAGLVSDTLAVMQMEVGKGAKVTDILAKGSSLANTRMTDLGLAISYAGQYAKPANLDLEKLVAILDVLANNSLRGERGGTGLRAVLAQLSDPASKASQAIKRLNLPTDDFIGLIEGLKQKGPEATEAINAFGIEAGPALRALISAGAEGITEFEQKLRDVDGAAKQMAKTATDDLPGGIKEAESAWDGLIKTFGKPLLKPLTELARDLAAKFREMNQDGNLKAWGDITAAALGKVAATLRIVYNLVTFTAKGIGIYSGRISLWANEAMISITRLLNKVGLASDETLKSLELNSGALRAAIDALVSESEQDLKDMGAGWDQLTGNVKEGMEDTRQASEASAKQAQQSGEAVATAAETAEAAAKRQAQAQQEAAEAAAKAAREQSEAWQTLGHDVDEVTGSLTESGSAAITAFETIATSGNASAEQINLAFASALEQAKTQEDIEAIKKSLIGVGNSGRLMAKYVADGLVLADQHAQKLSGTLSNDQIFSRSLKQLGIDLLEIKSGLSEVDREALAAFGSIQDHINATGAAAEQAAELTKASFTKALDQISTTKGLDELKAKLLSAAKEGRLGWGDYQKALEAVEAKYADLEKAAESSIFGQTKQLQALKAQAESAGQAIAGKTGATSENTKANKDNTESTDDQTKSVEKYTHALTMAGKTQQEFAEMGSQMAAEYDRIWQEIESAYKGKEITSTMQYLREMERAEAAMNKMAAESINRWRQQETAISNVEQALERGVRVSEQMLNGLDLVDQQRLEGVRSAIRNMNAEAQQVADTLKGTVASLQQQLADLQGDQARSEQIAQEQRMLQLREQYEQAKSTGNTEAVQAAREAIRLQEQIHKERMRQIRQQKVEAAQAQQVASTVPDNVSRNTPSRPQSPTPTPDRVVRVELDLGMGRPVAGEFEPSAAEALLQQLNTVRRTS